MRNNETGEFELVVGNRQLLSGFFIVVLLFAVAFAMGYVVGENSRTAKAQSDTAAAGAAPPTPADTRPQASGPPASAPAPAPAQPAEPAPSSVAQVDPAPPQPTTQPAREVREPEPAPKPRHETPPPPVRETPVRETPVRETPARTEALGLPAAATQAPPAGSYWQVTSTTNPESAQNLLHALRDKGFPAILGPGPNGFTRVLVGPHHENGSLSKSKTDLENAGFSKLVLVKH